MNYIDTEPYNKCAFSLSPINIHTLIARRNASLTDLDISSISLATVRSAFDPDVQRTIGFRGKLRTMVRYARSFISRFALDSDHRRRDVKSCRHQRILPLDDIVLFLNGLLCALSDGVTFF
jgi:hypothetical protein